MIVDLHSHTSAYSECGRDSLTAMVRAAMDRGLDALCVTEHDVVYPEERADAEVGGGGGRPFGACDGMVENEKGSVALCCNGFVHARRLAHWARNERESRLPPSQVLQVRERRATLSGS